MHSRLSPSSSARWLACPGSALAVLPDTSGPEAEWGTKAHELAAARLTGPEGIGYWLSDDEEMQEIVSEYVEYVQGIAGELFVEQRIESVYVGDFGGTIDTLITVPDELHVIDLKTGHREVTAANNPQLASYLCLARERFPGRKRFFGHLVQPRIGRPTCAEFTDAALTEHLLAVARAENDTTLRAGDHCRYCPLLKGCEVARAHALRLAQQIFDDSWTVAQCEEIMAAEDLVVALGKLAKKHILSKILCGEKVPGWKASSRLGNREWAAAEEIVAVQWPGVEVYERPKLKSPAKLEKLLPKEERAHLNALTHRPKHGPILTSSTSTLPDYVPADGTVFPDLEPTE